MKTASAKPWVGVVCDVKTVPPHPFHMAGDKYLAALASAADVVPVLLPALTEYFPAELYLDRLDGIFLTGGYSMVHPSLYKEEPAVDERYDIRRDAVSMQLIEALAARDLPVLAACRGCQEINVAMGGRLHQRLHRVPGLIEHREDKALPLTEQYAASHDVSLTDGGVLQRLLGTSSLTVNSLHVQGIAELGSGLHVEATAPDGLIEAFSIDGLSFALAVQWHPEWQVMNHPFQQKLFEAFGDACRA